MGLFKFIKNKDTTITDNKDDINKRWKEAYQANPKVYEKEEDDTLIVSFALTEDTDSLFPIVPEEQWALNGKKISLWMITIISLTKTKGEIIGEIEYHEAIKRLQPFIIATNGNWALIRAMTHDELDNLFKDLPRKLV